MVSVELDETTGTYPLRAIYPNSEELLLPGLFQLALQFEQLLLQLVALALQAVQAQTQLADVPLCAPELFLRGRAFAAFFREFFLQRFDRASQFLKLLLFILQASVCSCQLGRAEPGQKQREQSGAPCRPDAQCRRPFSRFWLRP